jgi:hypothetical protein
MKYQNHTLLFDYRLFLSLFVLVVLQFQLKGQNYLISEEQSGFHGGAEIAFNTFENFYAIFPGYTFKGRLTAGFGLGKNKDVVNKINSTLFRPYISYLIVKQDPDKLPLSIDLNVGYQYNYVTQLIFNAKSILFGAGVYHEISQMSEVKIIPALLIEGKKSINGPNPQFNDKIVFSYGAQTTLGWNNYNITPQFMISEGVVTISATIGIIFSSSDYED